MYERRVLAVENSHSPWRKPQVPINFHLTLILLLSSTTPMIWNQMIDMTGLTRDDMARTRTVKSVDQHRVPQPAHASQNSTHVVQGKSTATRARTGTETRGSSLYRISDRVITPGVEHNIRPGLLDSQAMILGSRSSRMVSHVSRQKPWSGNGGTGRPSFLWTCFGFESSRDKRGAKQLRPIKTRYLRSMVSCCTSCLRVAPVQGITTHVLGRRPPRSFRLTLRARLIAPPMVVASWYRLCQRASSLPFRPGSE